MRLFTAITLPEPVKRHLTGTIGKLNGRWPSFGLSSFVEGEQRLGFTRAENLHATLKFLGEVEESRVSDLCTALAKLEVNVADPLVVDQAALLPPRGPVRIIAVGLGGDSGTLNRLYRSVEECCAAVGFAREKRPYRAHITLARARNPLPPLVRDSLIETIETHMPGPPFRASEFVLMQSLLKPAGAEYLPVARFPLGTTTADNPANPSL